MKYELADLIDLVSDLVGLREISKATTFDMVTELQPIQDHSEYVKYLKSRINVKGMEYLPAYQKFIKLTEQYKNIEIEVMNKNRIELMGSLAEKLAQKVKQFDTMVLNHPHKDLLKWEHIKSMDDAEVNYFSDKEVKALSSIGNPLHCIELQRAISGKDALCERLEAIFIQKVTQTMAIENKSDNVPVLSSIAELTKEKVVK